MYNVVIAEDDYRVAQIHEEYLAAIDDMKLVGKALTGEDAMRLLGENKVDLLLLDVYMPDQLGTDLLHKIREEHPEVDIMLITAAKEKAFLEKAIRYGVHHYLIKPITLERFKETINQYKKKKVMLQETADVDQSLLDRVFGKGVKEPERSNLPPGIDAMTLKKVKKLLEDNKEGITSEKAGEILGASRTTARRYLEYLVGIEQATVEQVYGIVGRPERRYYARG
ncbi:response regulator [Pseudalkalibacillus salsuginis]|uniref:response regulator n=1 Tax=Pseudalkalibacillus salsuginis TaxID=2910972 RepID=UPI001F158AE8|nr:response regulator [Pseudalkalibacillus salsuginis]MCF6411375.1 response regulator [Pseudalkalibacillus salsuginis]